MMSNHEFVAAALDREKSSPDLTPQNFTRIDAIMSNGGGSDEVIYESVLDLKVIRMKKVMIKYGTVILSPEQAGEIWGDNS